MVGKIVDWRQMALGWQFGKKDFMSKKDFMAEKNLSISNPNKTLINSNQPFLERLDNFSGPESFFKDSTFVGFQS